MQEGELQVSEKPKFKVGDKVENIGTRSQFSVTEVSGDQMKLDHYNGWYPMSAYKFQETSETYLQSLVNKANEGANALRELEEKHPDRLEYSFYQNKNDQGFIKIHRKTDQEWLYRLTPPKPRERKFRLQDWDVVINSGEVIVGCKHLIRDVLQSTLTRICKQGENNLNTFYSTRKGVQFDGHTLTWENADKLLAELEAFEKESK